MAAVLVGTQRGDEEGEDNRVNKRADCHEQKFVGCCCVVNVLIQTAKTITQKMTSQKVSGRLSTQTRRRDGLEERCPDTRNRVLWII